MRNPSVYVGFMLLSEEKDGHKRVSTFDGLMWAGLDDLQATMLEDLLTAEFGAEFDDMKQRIRARTVELGYAAATLVEDPETGEPAATDEQVEIARGMAKGKAKKAEAAPKAPAPKAAARKR